MRETEAQTIPYELVHLCIYANDRQAGESIRNGH